MCRAESKAFRDRGSHAEELAEVRKKTRRQALRTMGVAMDGMHENIGNSRMLEGSLGIRDD